MFQWFKNTLDTRPRGMEWYKNGHRPTLKTEYDRCIVSIYDIGRTSSIVEPLNKAWVGFSKDLLRGRSTLYDYKHNLLAASKSERFIRIRGGRVYTATYTMFGNTVTLTETDCSNWLY